MRSHHCEKDVGTKVAAFANHLESSSANQETPNLTTENVELLTKFATFLQHEKRMHIHGWDSHWQGHHDHKHGKFGKHGHHGMLGHHFGRHGPYGKHRHGHHGHGHHGHGPHGHGSHSQDPHGHEVHGHGHGKHGRHGFEFRKHFEFGRNSDPDKNFCKQNKMGKHFWKHFAMFKMANPEETIVIEDESIESDRNIPASPLEKSTVNIVPEGSAEKNNMTCVCERKDRHCGRRWRAHEWVIVRKTAEAQPQTVLHAAPQAVPNETAQDNLATMVENITIENVPQKE